MTKKVEENRNIDILKEELKQKSLGNFYIFHGEEAFLREYYFGELCKMLLDDFTREFNFHKFTTENLDVHAVADSVEALPMMAEHSVVQLDDVDLFKLEDADKSILIGVFNDIPDYCTVILTYDAVPYKKDGKQQKLCNALSKALDVEFAKQTEKELIAWIIKHFKAYKKDISREDSSYFIRRTGGLMTAMLPEIEKVANYSLADKVSRADIDAVVEPVLEAAVFDLSNALLANKYRSALDILSIILQKGEKNEVILGAICTQFRKLLYAKVFIESNKDKNTFMSAMGMPEYPARLTMEAAAKLPRAFFEKAVLLCADADMSLKLSYGAEGGEILRLLLLQIAEERKNA